MVVSFWGIYFGVGLILQLILLSVWRNDTAAALFSLFVVIPFMIFAIVGTWRSANKYKIDKQKKKKRGGWGTAAQVYIFLSIIRGVVMFIKEFSNF